MASSGRLLRAFSLSADCDGGPHEFRGVRRSALVAALAARLAPGSIAFGCEVASVEPGSGGGGAAPEVRLATGEALPCLAVVAADGARSVAAAAAGRRPPRYVGQTAIR